MARESIPETLRVAERVAALLRDEGVASAVIGALAMAAHNYSRATADVDLATATNPFTVLRKVADACRDAGWSPRLVTPDEDDPLGGVLTIRAPGALPVQVVNFHNPLRPTTNPGAEAIATAVASIEASALAVVDVAHLVALKLYAGGLRSEADIVDLLACNPDVDRDGVAEVCARFGLRDDFERLRLAAG